MKRTKRLLLDEYPLMVLPSLAKEIGLDNAVMLQQIHYWIDRSGKEVEGQEGLWIYNTIEEWQKQMPFWSASTIRRIFVALVNDGLVKTGKFSKDATDHTKWYTIDYEVYDRTVEKIEPAPKRDIKKSANRIAQNEQIELVNLNTSNYTDTTTEKKEKTVATSKNQERPQDPLFNAIRDTFEMVNEERIGLTKAIMLGVSKNPRYQSCNFDTPVTAKEVLEFGKWYKSKYPTLNFPHDPPKIQTHFYAFRNNGGSVNKTRISDRGITQEFIQGLGWTDVWGAHNAQYD